MAFNNLFGRVRDFADQFNFEANPFQPAVGSPGFESARSALLRRGEIASGRAFNITGGTQFAGLFAKTKKGDFETKSMPFRPTSRHGHFTRRDIRHVRRVHRRAVRRMSTRTPMRRRASMPTRLASSGMSRAAVASIGRSIFNKPAVFPPTLSTKLVTSTIVTAVTAAATNPAFSHLISFNLNSAIDPLNTIGAAGGSAQQPLFFDQLKALYGRSVVLAAKVTVVYLQSNAATTYKISSSLNQLSDVTDPTDEQATGDPQNTLMIWRTTTNEPQKQVTFSRYVNMSRFFGRNVVEDDNFAERGTTAIADNTKICTIRQSLRLLTNANTGVDNVQMRVQITQWIKFSERKKPAAS